MPELEQPSQDNQNINNQAPVQPTRAEITEKKKRRFIKYVKALVTLSIVIALIPLVWIAISTYISQNKGKVLIKDEGTAPPIIETIPPTEDPLRTYTNEHFKFSFKYLKEDKLIAPAFVLGENQKIEVIFGKSLPAEDITEFNLADGYIFRIIPLVLSIQDINKIATIKQTTLKGVCPS
nr:hypothetical protein [Patescibacteria group bacterium]